MFLSRIYEGRIDRYVKVWDAEMGRALN
jgi:hypothetical protein